MAHVALAHAAAAEIYDAFTLYQRSFKRITRCAKGRFEQRDWHGHERDSVARLDLYKRVVDRCVYDTRNLLGAHVRTKGMWAEMRAAFSALIAGRVDIERPVDDVRAKPGHPAPRVPRPIEPAMSQTRSSARARRNSE